MNEATLMNTAIGSGRWIEQQFYDFINDEVLVQTDLDAKTFWGGFKGIIRDLAPINRTLLAIRDRIQAQLDEWHQAHSGEPFNPRAYLTFLKEIGYLIESGKDFIIETEGVDAEIATVAAPQLVVPLKNARFALNAANARWGSLYDALYGTDVIPQRNGLKAGATYNKARGQRVITYGREFLDEVFPLATGSHRDVSNYIVSCQHLLAFFHDGNTTGLKNAGQFVAVEGELNDPQSIILKNNGLHVDIELNRHGKVGSRDLSAIDDIKIEAALTTIMDCEDSVAAVDPEDKLEIYRNWLGLMQGNLNVSVQKGGRTLCRQLMKDRTITAVNGDDYILKGRSLLLIRNVGHLMGSDLMMDAHGKTVPEGIIDTVVTALIGSLDLNNQSRFKNSAEGSIYIIKPKIHGPEEVAFTCELFNRVEDLLRLKRNTIKLGIMDEERRTTVNLKECIRAAKERVFFINTGYLDRTGDEIHTSMQAGAFLPKEEIKKQPWIAAYENRNVDIGLACGFQGRAQIGKGMWAMPDEMNKMMAEKIEHPRSGATTAWVPSPAAATLHALHYHRINVFDVQENLKKRKPVELNDILNIPLLDKRKSLSADAIDKELSNNIQSILGYVVRWIEMGIGCSKVPDINNTGLMEDRATLRISSQHIANWLLHGLCDEWQVNYLMQRMAEIVDEQNRGVEGYVNMTPDTEKSQAFQAARKLIFTGMKQPNGYTEPLLHRYRQSVKNGT